VADLALLQHAQELDLSGDRHVADLVQEERAVLGVLEAAAAHLVGAREGALLVPEEFAFEDALREGGAVEADERPRASGGVVVYRAGDEFLSRAAFALYEHRGVRSGYLREHVEYALHRLTLADDPFEAEVLVYLALQGGALPDHALFLRRLANLLAQDVHIHRLLEVGHGPFLHRLDGRADRAVAGEYEHLHLRPELLRLLGDLDAADVMHDQVGQDHVNGAGADDLEALRAGYGGAALAADPFKYLCGGLGFDGAVVDDQHLQPAAGAAFPAGVAHVIPPPRSASPCCAAGRGSGRPIGSRTVKHVPRPTSLWTSMEPPCSSTMRRAVGRPRPLPPLRVE